MNINLSKFRWIYVMIYVLREVKPSTTTYFYNNASCIRLADEFSMKISEENAVKVPLS